MSPDPDGASGFPLMDETVHLSSGTTVRIRNIVVVRHTSGTTLSLIVERGSSWEDHTPFVAEELANAHSEFAKVQAATRIAIGICDTPACVELTAAPSEIYFFTGDASQEWRLTQSIRS
jgi:hypothetical protein